MMTMRYLFPWVFVVLFALCAACDGEQALFDGAADVDADVDGDADTDTDADTDSDTDADADADGDTDTGSETGAEVPDWLIHVSDGKLWHISIETALATDICDLVPDVDVILPTFQSVTFTRDDVLMASSVGDKSLWWIALPSCEITKTGDYSDTGQVFPGVCPDAATGLFGISPATDNLFAIDPTDAVVSLIGALGVDFGNTGATWVEDDQEIYGITDLGAVDGLYHVDKISGAATQIAELTENFGSVGMEHHPHDGMIYGCTNPGAGSWESAPLFRIDLDGTVTVVGLTGLPGNCDNLGAPWGNPELPGID